MVGSRRGVFETPADAEPDSLPRTAKTKGGKRSRSAGSKQTAGSAGRKSRSSYHRVATRSLSSRPIELEQDDLDPDHETPEQAVPSTGGPLETRMQKRLKQATIKAESEEAEDEVADDLGTEEDEEALDEDAMDDEESDSEDADLEEEEVLRYRRSERDRKHVQRYSPKAGQAGEFTLGTKRRRSIVDQQEDEAAADEEEEEDDEDMEEGDEGIRRYPLRDRAKAQVQPYVPGTGGGMLRRAGGPKAQARRGRRHGSRPAYSGKWSDEDDVADQHHELPPWQGRSTWAGGFSEGIPAGVSPRARAGAMDGRPPWEVPHLGGPGILDAGKDRKSNAEITPLEVDPSVSFDQVGGLDHYIKALKEMVFLPLVYPELFERFHLTPPRGVLFYGPPGTGKTLVARALAASASRAGRKVAFFMRKGADILSKWVGEAERQLRLLFEEAQRQQPAIIFFDEIDGLAPVRSSKQDQIHNSIVSTLLALMDGLDSRGSVVVIGATNRVDALDAALRRPGRFDRELVFPLPSLAARASILDIHTRHWADPPSAQLRAHLAQLSVGYCGADLKALCTEASLHALRRRYPQIYDSDDKLLIDPASIAVEQQDFVAALSSITPASHRSAAAHARPLPGALAPLLQTQLDLVLEKLCTAFPPARACLEAAADGSGSVQLQKMAAFRGRIEGLAAIRDEHDADLTAELAEDGGVARPRVLVSGSEGFGQDHLAPALLHALEGLPVHSIGLPALLSDASARSPEEAVVHAVMEARRAAPAILHLPHLQLWWDTAPPSLRATLRMLLADLPGDLPLLLMASADVPLDQLDEEAAQLFSARTAVRHEMEVPQASERAAYFGPVLAPLALPPPPPHLNAQRPPPPELPKAPEAAEALAEAARLKKEAEARAAYEADVATVRELRMCLRDVATRLLTDRRWRTLALPVTPQEDPEYWQRVTSPMDLATLLSRVDARQIPTVKTFLDTAALIPAGEQQFWGSDPEGIREVSKAHAMLDEARLLAERRVPPAVAQRCEEIHAAGGLGPPPPGALPDVLPPAVEAAPAHGPLDARLSGARDRDAANMTMDRWQRPSRSSRLRGDDLDRRIVNIDPERILREQRAQRRLQSQSQARKGQEAAAQQHGGPSSEHVKAADDTMAGANAVEGGADGAADLVDLTSPGAAAMTPAPRLAMPHQALTEPSTGTSQGSEQLPNGATPAQPCLSGLPTESDLPTNLGIRVTRRRGNAGEATVTKGMRQPPEAAQEVTDRSESGAGDFTATLANFMAGGIDAAMPDLAGARGGSGQPPEEALLSPVPTAGCHVLAAPPSAAGSVPGSSGKHLPAGHDGQPSAQKSILASSKRLTPSAMHAASAVKPPRKGGVKWADGTTLSPQPASDRRKHAEAESSPAAEARAAGRVMFDSAGPPGHTPFRSSRFVAPAKDSGELQDAADVAADGSVEEAEAAAVGGALGTCNSEPAPDVADLPSSSTGGVPHRQQAVQKQRQKRTALPEHARMVIELQEKVVQGTEGWSIQQLEELRVVLIRCGQDQKHCADRAAAIACAAHAIQSFIAG
ncbi:g13513 [Coccomyxa viridis]|uniref:G13513 protein n=1 Tax=Coccomyxa viridis TaxID=1274662 RepID=A0ABP1GDU8_9CHLO